MRLAMERLSARRAPLTVTMTSPAARETTLTSLPLDEAELRKVLAQGGIPAHALHAHDLVGARHCQRELRCSHDCLP